MMSYSYWWVYLVVVVSIRRSTGGGRQDGILHVIYVRTRNYFRIPDFCPTADAIARNTPYNNNNINTF